MIIIHSIPPRQPYHSNFKLVNTHTTRLFLKAIVLLFLWSTNFFMEQPYDFQNKIKKMCAQKTKISKILEKVNGCRGVKIEIKYFLNDSNLTLNQPK